jgi:hypothetical protein
MKLPILLCFDVPDSTNLPLAAGFLEIAYWNLGGTDDVWNSEKFRELLITDSERQLDRPVKLLKIHVTD